MCKCTLDITANTYHTTDAPSKLPGLYTVCFNMRGPHGQHRKKHVHLMRCITHANYQKFTSNRRPSGMACSRRLAGSTSEEGHGRPEPRQRGNRMPSEFSSLIPAMMFGAEWTLRCPREFHDPPASSAGGLRAWLLLAPYFSGTAFATTSAFHWSPPPCGGKAQQSTRNKIGHLRKDPYP